MTATELEVLIAIHETIVVGFGVLCLGMGVALGILSSIKRGH